MNVKKIVMCFMGIFILLSLYAESLQEDTVIKIGSVNSGYLFYDGKYLEGPYEFTKKGFSIFVNGYKLYFPAIIIKHLLLNKNIENFKISDIPRDITYDEFYSRNKYWRLWERKQIKKIIKKYPDDYMEHLMLFYKKLPFIKKVQINSRYSNQLYLETYNGDKENFDFNGFLEDYEPERIFKKSYIEQMVIRQNAFDNIMKLKRDSCIFLFSDTEKKWVLSFGDVKNNLPEIIDVLNSKDSNNEKINKLYHLRVFKKRKNKRAEILVNNFSPNKPLSERIADILQELKIKNFKRVKIEDIPPKEELIAKKMQAIKATEAKWLKAHPEDPKHIEKMKKIRHYNGKDNI